MSTQQVILSWALCLVLGIKPSTCPVELWAQGVVGKQSHNKINAKAQVSKGTGGGGAVDEDSPVYKSELWRPGAAQA